MSKDYKNYSSEQLLAEVDKYELEITGDMSDDDIREVLMRVRNNTINRLYLLFYLLDNEKTGVSKEDLYQTLGITKMSPKTASTTFRRFINDLEFFKDHIEVTEKGGRWYARLKLKGHQQKQDLENIRNLFIQVFRPWTDNLPNVLMRFSRSDVRIDNHIINNLLDSILHEKKVNFRYKGGQTRRGYCLGFCLYEDKLYTFFAAEPHWGVYTFRYEYIDEVYPDSLISSGKSSAPGTPIKEIKERVYEKVKNAKNIFINFNADGFQMRFRFRTPHDYLQRESVFPENITYPDKKDKSIFDGDISFSGREEAFRFMQKWLGVYSVLEGEWMAEYFRERIEEALDELLV